MSASSTATIRPGAVRDARGRRLARRVEPLPHGRAGRRARALRRAHAHGGAPRGRAHPAARAARAAGRPPAFRPRPPARRTRRGRGRDRRATATSRPGAARGSCSRCSFRCGAHTTPSTSSGRRSCRPSLGTGVDFEGELRGSLDSSEAMQVQLDAALRAARAGRPGRRAAGGRGRPLSGAGPVTASVAFDRGRLRIRAPRPAISPTSCSRCRPAPCPDRRPWRSRALRAARRAPRRSACRCRDDLVSDRPPSFRRRCVTRHWRHVAPAPGRATRGCCARSDLRVAPRRGRVDRADSHRSVRGGAAIRERVRAGRQPPRSLRSPMRGRWCSRWHRRRSIAGPASIRRGDRARCGPT